MEKAACVLRVEIQSIMLYSRQRVSEKHHEYIDDRSGAESHKLTACASSSSSKCNFCKEVS